jgi:hypothetical protein
MSTGRSSIVSEAVRDFGVRLTRAIEAELRPEDSFDVRALVRDGKVSLRIDFLVPNPEWKPALRHLENESQRGKDRGSRHA